MFCPLRASNKQHSGHSTPNLVTHIILHTTLNILHLILPQDEEGKATKAWGGREVLRNLSVGVHWVVSWGPPLCLRLGAGLQSFFTPGELLLWTITHPSAINGSPECGVLSPNPWVMIIGGKCLWGNSYWELGVLERIYLLKISQQQFSLQLSSLSLCFLNIHETCCDFRLKICTRWVVPGILHLRWYWICF